MSHDYFSILELNHHATRKKKKKKSFEKEIYTIDCFLRGGIKTKNL